MNVFLSWSGERSKRVANLMSDWLSCVIQTCRPWVSTRDIDRGSLWFAEINDKLQSTSIGIICLTKENKDRPWILFEAGALAKGLNGSRVCTLLIDLKAGEIGDPLAQFNHTIPEKESIYQLVQTLNSSIANGGLNDSVLLKVFETYWPQFISGFEKIIEETTVKNDTPEKDEKLDRDPLLINIMEMLQSMSNRMRRLEKENFSPSASKLRRSSPLNSEKEEEMIGLLKMLKADGVSLDKAVDIISMHHDISKFAAEDIVKNYF